MIKFCSCRAGCEGYVVSCSKCHLDSNRCSSDNEEEAVEHARKIGYSIVYTSPTSPAKWMCKHCAKETK